MHQHQYPVVRMCRLLAVSPSAYYAWRKRRPCRRQIENERLTEQIRQIHQDSYGTYGCPRIHAELRAQGVACNHKRIERLMRLHQIRAICKRRRRHTTNSAHKLPVAPNLLDQDFAAPAPNRKWVADLSYVWTSEGWLYLAAVLDLFSRRIVGWATGERIDRQLVHKALQMALVNRRPEAELLHHSDRGSQYASHDYQALLADHQIQVSMSRTGNVYDNAVMESFFATLKTERVHRRQYQTRTEARTDIFAYIEGFYNRRRRHSALGYLSPDEFESVQQQQPCLN
jgi:putative transposase